MFKSLTNEDRRVTVPTLGTASASVLSRGVAWGSKLSNSYAGVYADVRPSADRTLLSRPLANGATASRSVSEGASLAPCVLGETRVRYGLGNLSTRFRRGSVVRFVGTKCVDGRRRRSVTNESVGTGSERTLPGAEFHQDWSLRRRVGIADYGFGRSAG